MAHTPKPKLDRSLPGAETNRRVKWGAAAIGLFGAVGTLLTLFFGLVNISPLWDLTGKDSGPQIYLDSSEYRIKHLPPTTDQLRFDYSGTRALLEGYLELRRTSCTLQALDANYGALEANEQRNKEALAHFKTVHGQTYMERGDIDGAVVYFEEARRLSPENPWAVMGLHWARTEQLRLLRNVESWDKQQQQEVKELLDILESLSRDLSELSIEHLAALGWIGGPGGVWMDWTAATGSEDVARAQLLRTWLEAGDGGTRHLATAPGTPELQPPGNGPEVNTNPEVSGDPDSGRQGGKHALLIGMATYQVPPLFGSGTGDGASDRLRYIERDGERLASSLARLGYRSTMLHDGGRARVLARLLETVHASREGDQLIVYYSGHGFTDNLGQGVLALDGTGVPTVDSTGITATTTSNGTVTNSILATAAKSDMIAVSEITTLLSYHRGEVLVVLDACRDVRPSVVVNVDDLETLVGPNPPTVIYSSSAGHPSIESPVLKSGVFTAALERYLAAHATRLRGPAWDADGTTGIECDPVDRHCLENYSSIRSFETLVRDAVTVATTAVGLGVDDTVNRCTGIGGTHRATLPAELDLTAAFDEIAATTTCLARELHGIEQVPELLRPAAEAH